jgi:uncharacterized protein involved in exopolysaccharide biosynthesis
MVLFRQRRTFVCVAGLVLAAAVLYSAFGTKYQASMKVLVRRGRADTPVSAGENAPLDVTRMAVTEEEINSEVELIRDRELMRRVVQEAKYGGRDWLHAIRMSEGRPQQLERAAKRLTSKIKVEPIKRTNLIAISFTAERPEVAAKVLQSLSKAYLEKHTAVHRPSGESSFFEQQKLESRRQLEDAQRKVLQFTNANGVVAAAQERDLALQRFSELDAMSRQAKIEVTETRQKVSELLSQLAKLPERTTTQIRRADNPELLKSLESTLLELQLKRIQMLNKFEPTQRLVQEVEQQIEQTNSAIRLAQTSPVEDETTDKNSHYEWAKLELERAQVQLKGLEARERAITAQESAYRAHTQRLGEEAIAQDELMSAEKAAQENYLLYVRKQEEARLDDALDERGIVNVAIAEQPTVPALPVWPVWNVIAMGIVAAAGAGTGAALVADYTDPGFRNPEDVSAYLHLPVLASLPRPVSGRLSA